MAGDEYFEDNNAFVQNMDENEFIPIDRIQVVSKSRQSNGNVKVRYQDGDEYPTAEVEQRELLWKVSERNNRFVPAAPGTWCIEYNKEEDLLDRWPIVAWRLGDKWTQPRQIMLDPASFDPTVDNFTILFPDGVVFRTGDESSWDSLDRYKESKRKEAMKAAE